MGIDINEPVKQGHDLVINTQDGEQHLGTGADFDKQVGKDNVVGLPPNDNPDGDPNSEEFKNRNKDEKSK